MHRNRTWTLDPPEWRANRNRVLDVVGGDGSTLNLDFTTGVLDPRLTFTRTTNATFINSQGLVQFAAANILRNSVMAGGSTSGLFAPTSWSAGVSGESYRTQIVIDGCEQWKQVASSTRPYMTITIPNTELAVGVEYVASVYVDSFTTGTLFATLDNFFSYNQPSGTTVSSVTWVAPNGSTGASQPLAIGRIQLRFVLSAIGASGFQFRIGIGVQNTATGTVEFSRPQCERGTVAKPFLANTSTSAANYDTPRFDYDPTTLIPRGLLIEGSAVNRLFQSSAFSTSPWGPADYNLTGTGYTSPDGSTLALRWTAGTGAITPGNVQLCSNVTSTSVTLSVWWRNGNHTNSTSNNLRRVAIRNSTTATILLDVSIVNPATVPSISYNTGSTGASLTTYQDGWYRLVLTVSSGITSGNNIQAYIGGLFGSVTGAGEYCYWWGAMLEDGSGASSYIPTGASTGSRAADSCVMTGTNFSSWFAGATEGVFYAEYEAPRFLGGSDYFCLGTVYAAGTFIGMNLANSTRYPQALISPGGGFRVSGGISVAASTPMKHAAKWSGVNNVLVFANGVVGTAHSATSGTPTLTMFSIGSSSTSGTAATGDYLNACIRRVKFWPVALSNAQIQSITTG